MKKVIACFLLLTILLSLCACRSEEDHLQQFCIGSFSTPQDDCFLVDILEFYPGGSCSVPEYTWSISEDVLNITVSLPDNVQEVYGFTIDTEEGILKALFDNHVLYYKD